MGGLRGPHRKGLVTKPTKKIAELETQLQQPCMTGCALSWHLGISRWCHEGCPCSHSARTLANGQNRQCLRRAARSPAAQRIPAFSTGLRIWVGSARKRVRAFGLQAPCAARPLGAAGHHSLVTPIDWKLSLQWQPLKSLAGHHSLVTPIDWKPWPPGSRSPWLCGWVTTRW